MMIQSRHVLEVFLGRDSGSTTWKEYCRKPTNTRGCSAPPAVRLAATMILPSALTPPVWLPHCHSLGSVKRQFAG
jgi:hypothetical protein